VKAVRVLVKGRVQGVGYRFFASQEARRFGLTGQVHNLPDGSVEAEAEGPIAQLERWVAALRKGPSLAHVTRLQAEWLPPSGRFTTFDILP